MNCQLILHFSFSILLVSFSILPPFDDTPPGERMSRGTT